MHPAVHGNSEQNLSEATVPVGGKTFLHKHRVTEEIYHILSLTVQIKFSEKLRFLSKIN